MNSLKIDIWGTLPLGIGKTNFRTSNNLMAVWYSGSSGGTEYSSGSTNVFNTPNSYTRKELKMTLASSWYGNWCSVYKLGGYADESQAPEKRTKLQWCVWFYREKKDVFDTSWPGYYKQFVRQQNIGTWFF